MRRQARVPETAQTIPEALAFWAERTPDAPALRPLGGCGLSYKQLWQTTVGAAARLRELGLGPSDLAAVVMPPGFDGCIAMLGVMTGAVAVPLLPEATDHELTRDLSRLPIRAAVIGGGPAAERMGAIAARLSIPVVAVEHLSCPCPPSAPGGEAVAARPESTAVILHTSGTTGLPKRVPRSHRALVVGARAAFGRTGLTPEDDLLLTAGLANISGLGNLLIAMLSGGSCLAAPGFDPAAFGGWLEEERPTWTFLTPTQLRLLLEMTDGNGAAPVGGERSRLRLVRAGTQPLPAHTRRQAEQRLCAPILDTYGMSEAHSIAASGPDAADRREGSPGKPLDIAVRITDEAGADVATGTVGSIVVLGPTVMDGYLDDPEASAAAFTPDGWFRTGDLGHLDGDGFLFITGRAKEQINRGGEQIAPAEIDRVLLEHPAVAEAAAFAVPDARLGEDIVAAVVLRPGMTATARELRRWLLDRLAASRAPRRIWFVDGLPRTRIGKIQRGELRRRWIG